MSQAAGRSARGRKGLHSQSKLARTRTLLQRQLGCVTLSGRKNVKQLRHSEIQDFHSFASQSLKKGRLPTTFHLLHICFPSPQHRFKAASQNLLFTL